MISKWMRALAAPFWLLVAAAILFAVGGMALMGRLFTSRRDNHFFPAKE